MTNSSQDPAAASNNGCFSSVLRRLLCAGGLPTHPSSSSDNEQENSTLVKLPPPPPSPTTTPAGIVARLMGIDSFPNSPKVSLATFMRKSRSVSSLPDFLPNFPHHRRVVTTSLSFRELTGNKSDDMGGLTLIQEKSTNLRKSDMGLTPIQEKSNNLSRGRVHTNVKNTNSKGKCQSQSQSQRVNKLLRNNEQEIQVSSVALKMRRKKGVINGGAKKKKKNKLVDDDDDDGFPLYKSRDTKYNHRLPKMVKHEEKKKKEKKKSILKQRRSELSRYEYSQEYCMKALTEVCRLTMAEVEGGVWVDTKVMGVNNNLQEISYQISQHILYVLVYDLVDELCNS